MKNILIVLLSLLLFSCNNAKKNKNKEVIENSIIENQGVAIAYDDSKTGDTVLVFIHGFGINKTYWKNQTAFFEKKYRVIAIDLPGFGLSGKNRNSWAVEDFSKDVTAVLTQLDLKNVILIGHSMSGAIALETALKNPTKIIGIVGIDNFKTFGKILTPKEKEEFVNIYNAARANFKKVITEYANQGFFATSTDTIIRKRVMNDVTKTNSEIGVTTMEEGDKYPIDQKLKLFKRTLYLINSDLIPTDTLAFEKNNIEYKLLNIGTTGHYPMIEKPNEFNLLLQQTFFKTLNKYIMKATSIIPSILYKDANAAIDWLCNAFGFEKHLIVPNESGTIVHAELTLGNIMVMVGSTQSQSEYSKLIKQPNEIGNFETQSPYIVLEENDIEAHYETATKNGAKIIIELKSQDYGGKDYACYDPEGHLWNFGSYDPWKTESK